MNLRCLVLIGLVSLGILTLSLKANDTYIQSYWSPNSDEIALLGSTDIVIFDSDFQVEQRIILPPSSPPPIDPGPIVWSPLQDKIAVYVGNFNLWSGGSVEIWDIATGQRIGTTGETPSSNDILMSISPPLIIINPFSISIISMAHSMTVGSLDHFSGNPCGVPMECI